MGVKTYTIGEMARLSGLSVRRIRFYSDKGLLPPTGRTASNYRIYTNLDLARLDLIRALRAAGVGLGAIAKLLARRLSLTDVLHARLEVLEAEIAAKRRTAAVLRATLRSHDPTDAELRRLWMMTTLSNAQMGALVETFVGEIADGAAIDDEWRRRMVAVSTPVLPDDPTAGQIEAWNELAEMLTDKSFVAEMQTEMAGMWNDDFDPATYRTAAEHIHDVVLTAIERGLDPVSEKGRAIGRDWLQRSAKAMRRAPDGDFLDWHLAQYRKHHGRTARYRELLSILQGQPAEPSSANEWTWMNEALAALRPEFA